MMYKVKQMNRRMNINKFNNEANNRNINIKNENDFPTLGNVKKKTFLQIQIKHQIIRRWFKKK